ncbi:MAG: hypothetical protein CMO01_32960 [Thalassobius sp.]|nr:hypothetical protein [Thalassovita sp.]
MTKRLLIVRHSEAEYSASSRKDFDRALSEQGMVYANRQGRKLYETEFKPDYFASSNAVRAESTAKILAEQMRFDQREIDFMEELYNMPMGPMLDWIGKQNEDFSSIMIVGHNPLLSYLIEYITGDTGFHMQPCDIVMLEMNIESWMLIGRDCGKLLWRL